MIVLVLSQPLQVRFLMVRNPNFVFALFNSFDLTSYQTQYTKPNLVSQIGTLGTKPNLLSQIGTLGTKPNLLNQIYQSESTKQNLQN